MPNPLFNFVALRVFLNKTKTVKCPNCGHCWKSLRLRKRVKVKCERCGTEFYGKT